MQQGDQYSISISIQQGGQALKPADIEGLKIRIGSLEQSYPDGGILYDVDGQKWLFPVTQAQTLGLEGTQLAQVQVNFGGTPPQIVGSAVQSVNVDFSVIGSAWDGE